jgi:hypothetical protein
LISSCKQSQWFEQSFVKEAHLAGNIRWNGRDSGIFGIMLISKRMEVA